MIPRSGTLTERVVRLMKARVKEKGGSERATYAWVPAPGPVTVREAEREGEATVELTLPAGCECLELWLPTGMFNILAEDKNADGALLVAQPDGTLEAHVVECKKTVDSATWGKARAQMMWTLVKLQALAGALGEQIAGAVCYTAFREDRLSEDESPNPAYSERIIGVPESAAEQELRWGRRTQLEWMRGRIHLTGYRGELAHHRIPLDAAGRGAGALVSRAG